MQRSWHKFLMKRGLGSPGYIARRMGRRYLFWRFRRPFEDERAILRFVLYERIAVQSRMGGPLHYQLLRGNGPMIENLLDQHPDLFALSMLVIFIEHPELLSLRAPADAFEVLNETVQEVLDETVLGWRARGVWARPVVTCSRCWSEVRSPNPAYMAAYATQGAEPLYLCPVCAPSLRVRAMSIHALN
jgi:hypothetical protein